jgi:precorrin-8X/cobalt-precorrin-8 methylmutase
MTLPRGEAILAESFRIIEREVGPHSFDALQWPIVRRMIHASGDLELARCVHFSPGAARAGVEALRQGVPLVTDVGMVLVGVRDSLCEQLGVRLHCFIDLPEVAAHARASGQTRSYHAMLHAVAIVGEAVYVIGNAPTALHALCAAVRAGEVRPRLVLALPVGFVGVEESKAEALALDVPVIAVRGRKGGSGMAAAAVNALLHLAVEDSTP